MTQILLIDGEVCRSRCVLKEELFVETGLTHQRVGTPGLRQRLLSRVRMVQALLGRERRALMAIEISEGAHGPVRLERK